MRLPTARKSAAAELDVGMPLLRNLPATVSRGSSEALLWPGCSVIWSMPSVRMTLALALSA